MKKLSLSGDLRGKTFTDIFVAYHNTWKKPAAVVYCTLCLRLIDRGSARFPTPVQSKSIVQHMKCERPLFFCSASIVPGAY